MVQINTASEQPSEDVKKSREKKTEVSMILSNDTTHQWIDANKHKPGAGEPVIFRMENRTTVKPFAEDNENIIYAEDEKVGRYVRDINNPDKGRWVIDPPYTKYDYSPLSFQDHLLEGSVVTHWAYLMEGELEGWKTRLNPLGDYEYLRLSISPDYEEILYKALLNGASWIARSCNGNIGKEGYEIQSAMYAALTDLQYCIDNDCSVHNGKLVANNTPDPQTILSTKFLYNELLERYGDKDKLANIINALKILSDKNIGTSDEDESDDTE